MHHQMLADALEPLAQDDYKSAIRAADYLSVMLEKDNHLFDPQRFKSAILGGKIGYR